MGDAIWEDLSRRYREDPSSLSGHECKDGEDDYLWFRRLQFLYIKKVATPMEITMMRIVMSRLWSVDRERMRHVIKRLARIGVYKNRRSITVQRGSRLSRKRQERADIARELADR